MQSLKNIAHVQDCIIPHNASLSDAMRAMLQNGNGSVILVDNDCPVGFISESMLLSRRISTQDLQAPAFKFAKTTLITLNENRPIDAAFDILNEHSIRRIILVDAQGKCRGVVFQEDLFDFLEDDAYKIDLRVSHILRQYQIFETLPLEATLHDAKAMMLRDNISSVIVADGYDYLGIITEKELLYLQYENVSFDEQVGIHMSAPLIGVSLNALVTETISMMRSKSLERVVVYDDTGVLVGILSNRDILQHVHGNYTRILQIKFRHAQELMDYLPEAIIEVVETNEYFMIHWMNRKARMSFGDALLEQPLTAIMTLSQVESMLFNLERFKSLEKLPLQLAGRMYEVSGSLSKNLNNRYIKLIFKDITEHELIKQELQKEIEHQIDKRMENEYLLMQQSKLATMGEMIGNIAHQWRQPLAELGGIFMNLDAANKFSAMDQKYLQERIKEGNMLLKHMSRTIDDFRHFFEPNRAKKEFNIFEYVESAINIIQASLTFHHIAIKREYKDENMLVVGFPSEFSQVILNLLANAKDALVERSIEHPCIWVTIAASEGDIIVSVEDNAGGIDASIMEHIFNIYFTTKKEGEGTGLGLYMSRLIIETKLHGSIVVANAERGACFTIKIKQSNLP